MIPSYEETLSFALEPIACLKPTILIPRAKLTLEKCTMAYGDTKIQGIENRFFKVWI